MFRIADTVHSNVQDCVVTINNNNNSNNNNNNKYFIYTAKNRPTEYEKTAGINLCTVIKYFKIKKEKTIVHSKKAERLIFTTKKVLQN